MVWDFARLREAVKARGGKIVNIDYRLNETSSGHSEEWLPIRTGTDTALVAAIAHEWINNNQIDKAYFDKYCVGYDEDTMPKSAKGKHRSYKDYIMGTGYDMVEKTPEWAAEITQIPADKIRELAQDIASAKAPAIFQGWGLSATRTARRRAAPFVCCPTSSVRSAFPARPPVSAKQSLEPTWSVAFLRAKTA